MGLWLVRHNYVTESDFVNATSLKPFSRMCLYMVGLLVITCSAACYAAILVWKQIVECGALTFLDQLYHSCILWNLIFPIELFSYHWL